MKAQLTFALLAAAVVWCASPASAQLDASCVASMTINFDPPAKLVLPPTPAPHTLGTGGGTIDRPVRRYRHGNVYGDDLPAELGLRRDRILRPRRSHSR
jgi:hypothetical protein